jgi:signal transduction histidine kinase
LLAVAVAVIGFAVTGIDTRYIVLSIGMLLIPASIAVAVLKYRLYDLDIVIRKAVVFLVIAGGLTVLSLGALLVLPTLAIGALSGTERLLIVLGVVIGLASVPLSRWGRRVANRVVYGRRATPYEVLSTFSSQVGTTFADDDVTIRMAGLLREATGALSATVWLNVDGTLHAVATSPDGSTAAVWPDEGVEVHYQGERLGGLSVEMPANDPLDATRGRLIRDLAGQAGPVLANVRLVEELRASRRRIVAAQDERAKKLERNIHDGAQQQLVALAVQLKLAEGMVGKDAEKQRELLARLGVQASEALEDLRDLARGIYPPLLQDKGLAAALEAQARKAVVPTTVHADGIGRFSEDVESAVYFSVLEALQNVAKYAEATSAEIALANSNGSLRFTVTDDGRGFDTGSTGYGTGLQGIADRLAAIGGEFAVTSSPGQGTTISGVVPA